MQYGKHSTVTNTIQTWKNKGMTPLLT